MNDKPKTAVGNEGKYFGEFLKKLIGVDPKEIESEIAKTKRKAEEIERGSKETEDSIDRGARRTKHRFRL